MKHREQADCMKSTSYYEKDSLHYKRFLMTTFQYSLSKAKKNLKKQQQNVLDKASSFPGVCYSLKVSEGPPPPVSAEYKEKHFEAPLQGCLTQYMKHF